MTDRPNVDSLLTGLGDGAGTQIDRSAAEKCKSLVGLSITSQLLGLIDIRNDCIMGGLASTFVMKAFDAIIDLAGSLHNDLPDSKQALENARLLNKKYSDNEN